MNKGKKWNKSSEELVDLFLETTKQFDGIDHKKMFGYPCCFVNGNMFTGLHEENWIVRLSEEDREEIIESHNTKIFEPFPGKFMKEYIVIPPSVRRDTETLKSWITLSLNYASTIVKKTAKKRKKPA